jgi:hypothetical protein
LLLRYLNLEISYVSTKQLNCWNKRQAVQFTLESKNLVPCQEHHLCIHQKWTLTKQHRRDP